MLHFNTSRAAILSLFTGLVTAAVISSLGAPAAYAQVTVSSIHGTVTDSSDPTAFSIMGQMSGSCIDDTNWSTTAIHLQLWACSGNSNQSWRFYQVGSTTPVSVQ